MPSSRSMGVFPRVANWMSRRAGRPLTFGVAFGLVIVWALLGPAFHYSDTWQLAINTSTTIVTFLMVFLIQNTQNRDAQAVQVKLDELIRSTAGARNDLLDLENLDEAELDRIRARYEKLATRARGELQRRHGAAAHRPRGAAKKRAGAS
jgi:low affinity Fe/Cu permease